MTLVPDERSDGQLGIAEIVGEAGEAVARGSGLSGLARHAQRETSRRRPARSRRPHRGCAGRRDVSGTGVGQGRFESRADQEPRPEMLLKLDHLAADGR